MKEGLQFPQGTEQHETRIIKIVLIPKGKHLYSDQVTSIKIDDEGEGEFVKVNHDDGDGCSQRGIFIEPEQWPTLRDAIEFMVGQCRKD